MHDDNRPIWEAPLNPRRFWKLAILLIGMGFGFAASISASRGEYAKASFQAIVAFAFVYDAKK